MVEPTQLLRKASDMESFEGVPGASLRFVRGDGHGLGRLVTGHHALRDMAILIFGVAVGAPLLILARRHRRSAAHRGG
jgi:hypothetical protein